MQDTTATPSEAPVEDNELTREEARHILHETEGATPEQLGAACRALGTPYTVQTASIRTTDEDGNEEVVPGEEISLREAFEIHDRHREAQRLKEATQPRVMRMPVARPRERRDNGGGRRRSATKRASGSRSGQDPGDPDQPDPPQTGRLCECGCGESIDHLRRNAKYLNKAHGDAARQRRRRARDKADPSRVVARRLERITDTDLARKCRCSAEAVDRDPEGWWVCAVCGLPRTVALVAVNGYDAHVAEIRSLMRNERAEVRQVRRRRSGREWRTRPPRKLAAKLRKARGRWDEPKAVA